jgi:hypothetical protein
MTPTMDNSRIGIESGPMRRETQKRVCVPCFDLNDAGHQVNQ